MPILRHARTLIVAILLLGGCTERATTGAAAPPAGLVNGLGETVALADLRGHYVWIDYAAEWCAACTPQTLAIKSAAASAPAQVVFVTLMTTEREGYGHPSTQQTAARWAARFDLDPAMVWAGNVNARFLPRNRLLSPRGDELFDQVGELSAAQIQQEIGRHLRD